MPSSARVRADAAVCACGGPATDGPPGGDASGASASAGRVACALARWPRGAVVVTLAAEGGAVARRVRAFSSVSLSPPLCALVVDDARALAPGVRVTVNVLSDAQRALYYALDAAGALPIARRRGARGDPAAGDASAGEAAGGDEARAAAPRLDGCSAWLDCAVHAVHGCGARALVLGRVLRTACGDAPPLLVTDAGPMACVPLAGETR